MGIRIEKATAEHRHARAAGRLLETTFPEWERESLEEFWADLRTGRGLELWVLVDDTDQFLGFARGCLLPRVRRGWIVHLALEPGRRGWGVGEAFLHLLRDHFQGRVEGFQGIYLEVERIEDAQNEVERTARTKRLNFFHRLGTRKITSGYTQPPSQDGQPPVPLNLLFWGEPPVRPRDLVVDFYREAFQYDESHPFVQEALEGIETD